MGAGRTPTPLDPHVFAPWNSRHPASPSPHEIPAETIRVWRKASSRELRRKLSPRIGVRPRSSHHERIRSARWAFLPLTIRHFLDSRYAPILGATNATLWRLRSGLTIFFVHGRDGHGCVPLPRPARRTAGGAGKSGVDHNLRGDVRAVLQQNGFVCLRGERHIVRGSTRLELQLGESGHLDRLTVRLQQIPPGDARVE